MTCHKSSSASKCLQWQFELQYFAILSTRCEFLIKSTGSFAADFNEIKISFYPCWLTWFKMWEGLLQWWVIMWLSKLPCYKVTTEIPKLELDGLRFSFPLGQLGSPFLPCAAVLLSMEKPNNSQESLQPKVPITIALTLRSHSLVLLCPWGLDIFDKEDQCKIDIMSWFHHPVIYAKSLNVCILIPTPECLLFLAPNMHK